MIGLRDWPKAYFVLGVRVPEDNPVAAWDPSRNRCRLWINSVLNMGSKFSVQSWCRVAELTMCICARLGKMVAPIYIDDAIIFGVGTVYASPSIFTRRSASARGWSSPRSRRPGNPAWSWTE